MVISSADVQAIIDHAHSEFPNECCGLLAGKEGQVLHVYPIRNAKASPVFYEMDAKEQLAAFNDMDDHDWDLLAVYHSHTHTRAYPSKTDVEIAQGTLALYPGTLYVIVSLAYQDQPDVRAFRIEGTEIVEEPVEISGE